MTSGRHSQQLGYVSPSSSASALDTVLLEQDKWDANINYLTKMGVVGYLNQLLYGGSTVSENCTNADGQGNPYTVFAYPSRQDLQFIIGTSHGSLSTGIFEIKTYTEILRCNLNTELTPRYPVVSILNFDWIGDAYSKDGDVVSLPILTPNGKTVTVSEEVYGSIYITYTVYRFVYSLIISPLQKAIENSMQCWIYVCWDGGNTALEYKFPDGVDTVNSAGTVGTCQNSKTLYNGTVNDKKPVTCVSPEDSEKHVDYCDQKI